MFCGLGYYITIPRTPIFYRMVLVFGITIARNLHFNRIDPVGDLLRVGWYAVTTTHCRCRKCQTRRALRHPPQWYLRVPKCRGCGGTDYRIDKWANARPWRKRTCRCDGYHFPHNQGRGWCFHNPDYERLQREYHGGEPTPTSLPPCTALTVTTPP